MNDSEKLQLEFEHLDQMPNQPLILFEAVVVFCAEEVSVVGENKARIDAGIELAQKIAKNQVVFLGTVAHIAKFKKYLSTLDKDLELIFPTCRHHESSWTQIKGLADYLNKKPVGQLLIVSHAYHLPRIKRYCSQYLINQVYDFFPIGQISQQTKEVENEIKKILRYSKKGDLPLWI